MSAFTIKVRNIGEEEGWEEHINKPEVKSQADAEKYGKDIVGYFNSALRAGEKAREFISASFGTGTAKGEHSWRKQNLMTLQDQHGQFDIVKCENCNAEARRYGLTRIVRQKQWRSSKWKHCPV